MSVILAWASFILQVHSMQSIRPAFTRRRRVTKGSSELNLGFYRRRVTWTETDASR